VREPHDKLLIIHALHELVGVELVFKLPVVCLVSFVYQLTEIVSCKRFLDFEIIHLSVHFLSLLALLPQYSLLGCLVIIFIASDTSSRLHIFSISAISTVNFSHLEVICQIPLAYFQDRGLIEESIVLVGIIVSSHVCRVVRNSTGYLMPFIYEIARITQSRFAAFPGSGLSDLAHSSKIVRIWVL
jgi:hypothetical protein